MKFFLEQLFLRKKLFLMLSVFLFIWGIYSYLVIPKQDMPQIDTPYMAISVISPGSSASFIQDHAVVAIENVVLPYEDVMEVRSYVYDNYALIYTVFSYSSDDPDALSEDIYSKIQSLSFDESITDITYSSGFDDPHIIFSVHSDTLTPTQLEQVAASFQNTLYTIDEIQSVEINTAFSDEVVITLNQTLLSTYQLTILDIYQYLYANSYNIPLGGINTDDGTITISGYHVYSSFEELQELIIIPSSPLLPMDVTLGDIATIDLVDTADKTYLFDDEQAVFLSVQFHKDIDFTTLGDEVLAVKQEFLSTTDASIDEMLFLPDYVNAQINSVFYSLLLAIGIVMVVVLIGIGFRNSLLVVMTIPVIVFGTLGILFIANFELHKMTIVGLIISIGMIVDNSIVITEGIKHNIDYGMEKISGAKQAIKENIFPILTSSLTTMAAFFVIVLLPGFLGRIVSSMPITVIITLSLSFLTSMILSPILAVLFLKPSKRLKVLPSIHSQRISQMIANTIRFPYIWIAFSILVTAVCTYIAFTTQPIDMYPNDERAMLYVDIENDVVNDKTSTQEIVADITAFIETNAQTTHIASSVGGDLPHFHFSAPWVTTLPQFARIFVSLDATEQELLDYVDALEIALEDITDVKTAVHILELSPPTPPLRVMISGDDIDEVTTTSASLFAELQTLEEVKSDLVVANDTTDKYVVVYDTEEMARSYLTKAEIDGFIAANVNGLDLAAYESNDDIVNIHLSTSLTSIEALLQLSIQSRITDEWIVLDNLVDINTITDYHIITRYNGDIVSYIDLYNTNDASIDQLHTAVNDVINETDINGLTISYSGENDLFRDIQGDLIQAALIALLLIFIILFIQFNNIVKPLIVLTTIPLSFCGSFLFLLIFNVPITATSLIGMISLMGVTVNTGILLVEYISRFHAKGYSVTDACVHAVLRRFRPIMLTSMTTILGLIPLLITGGNFFQPMAITFMGGMITSTLITIFFVPSLYTLLYHKKDA
ncbi:efflux RND transporter permease subunit [Candidatus Xianfuyuplasma coldseepsis]|uniref:Efflux RND transporter permease subunit n=1 Tax=Candidatus Xianfuyuplasma coldseepsis TaxID=2782163 RepID=A0A7L7KPJ7_9MOLU|nr:efflux RND transporter permease subunit [Xianfuyuplasma coldseepsis]QMS84359.1 efflux RND transporter permease subunit [Xianfuyuplasma coldseepsis]